MEKKLIIYIALLLTFSVLSHSAFSLSRQPSFQSLNESIHALDITRNKSLLSLNKLNSDQDKSLYNEYSVFIEYLSFRITQYCKQISEYYGDSLLEGLPCPKNISHSQKLDKKNYITADEKIESLDNELLTALGDFDEMLLEEHEKIAQTSQKRMTDNSASSGSGQNGNGNKPGKKGKKETNTDKEKENSNQTQTTEQSEQNTNRNSKGNQSGNRNYKKMKIDYSDDDIVARQLKEAAENETDPELKKKLWAEYEKYKQNKY